MKIFDHSGQTSIRLLVPLILVLLGAATLGGSVDEVISLARGGVPGGGGPPSTESNAGAVSAESRALNALNDDSLLRFLGSDFEEIRAVMGEPDETGSSGLYGPHEYMLFEDEGGAIYRFASPRTLDRKKAMSIIVGPGGQLMGIEVGMTLSEIEDRLGKPDWGPAVGKDNLYDIEYHLQDTNGTSGIYLSFSARERDGPTIHAFVKLKTER